MSFYRIRPVTKIFEPAAVGSSETTALFTVKAGQRVLWATVKPIRAAAGSTNSTIEIGDDGDTDRFVKATTDYDPEASAVGTLISGTGAGLANSGGYLYTADNTVDVVYTASGASGALPKLKVTLMIADDLA